ncbi:malonate decarboxylase holo-ACP synthase [Vibrio nitrifigilis]|uniref:Malonate decarboxylase holo-ACP synthase n=1 Tax=Vibrio nitrifigilis TaxID=2789781 RepID=A0ABS0GF17_9VIBR|nr:malonate decarboxylase holo-ACP synthase [Vibrio nitrifigilis]MBF9001006.1 malonate decarboxylase holo-ACP synthase [Vibrio nitrifigilis]
MQLVFQPHDLLWVSKLDDDNEQPDWFDHHDLLHRPVVVRREPTPADRIAIGIRGFSRSQRHASYVTPDSVSRVVTPEQIASQQKWHARQTQHPLPHWDTLTQVANIMSHVHLTWGITGSLAFELATDIETAHLNSDIDLRILSHEPLDKSYCRDVAMQLSKLEQRPDIQIETPYGAFAMNEWLNADGSIMMKGQHGPYLTLTPWQPQD